MKENKNSYKIPFMSLKVYLVRLKTQKKRLF